MTLQRLRVNIRLSLICHARNRLNIHCPLSSSATGPFGVRTEAADSIMNVVGDPEVSFPSLGPLVVLSFFPSLPSLF